MREIKKIVDNQHFFEKVSSTIQDDLVSENEEKATREMYPLYPFIISGGRNTERFYFKHVSDAADIPYKFNIIPEYFGNESQYTILFPRLIKKILKGNADAQIFCVFDMDTVKGNEQREKDHETFKKSINGKATLCPSMPSIEYWFLLHFEDCHELMKNWSQIAPKLAPYIRPCFSHSKGVRLKKLLKMEKYLNDPSWVKTLCKNGQLKIAIERAEKNIEASKALGTLDQQSYSYVYLVFK